MQNQINKIEKKVQQDHDTTTKQGADISYIKEKMDKFIDSANNCYANKYVEDEVAKIKTRLENKNSKSYDRVWQVVNTLVILLLTIILTAIGLK